MTRGLLLRPLLASGLVPEQAARQLPFIQSSRRFLRQRLVQSSAPHKVFTVDNPVTSKTWPPLETMGDPITNKSCRQLMWQLHTLEIQRMRKLRTFEMPRMQPGDLVEVRYELSRTQQTFAIFQGYCVEVRKKGLNSAFVLKNTYEGVGVEQLIPRYSPRLLDVRVVKPVGNPQTVSSRPLTRDYRYRWHTNSRAKFAKRNGNSRPGIRSVEGKVRRRISKIRKRYMRQRIEAGLPPYCWPGPYPMYQAKRARLVRAETFRRMMIYAYDERRRRAAKLRKRRQKERWGVYKIRHEPKKTALTALPSYHPLSPGNLPK